MSARLTSANDPKRTLVGRSPSLSSSLSRNNLAHTEGRFSASPRVLATVFGSVRRLVDLIEDAAIGEVGGLRLSPTAE